MRHRLIATSAAIAATLLAFPLPAQAAGTHEARFVQLINELRTGQGLASLEVHPVLEAKAEAWAQTMADQRRIWHSNVKEGITVEWSRLGENVGMGPTVDQLHDAFVASPHHYENLVLPDYRYVGLGVVEADGTLFVAEEFMTVRSPAPVPTPVSVPTTAPPPVPATAPAPPPAPSPAAVPATTPSPQVTAPVKPTSPAPVVAAEGSVPTPMPETSPETTHPIVTEPSTTTVFTPAPLPIAGRPIAAVVRRSTRPGIPMGGVWTTGLLVGLTTGAILRGLRRDKPASARF